VPDCRLFLLEGGGGGGRPSSAALGMSTPSGLQAVDQSGSIVAPMAGCLSKQLVVLGPITNAAAGQLKACRAWMASLLHGSERGGRSPSQFLRGPGAIVEARGPLPRPLEASMPRHWPGNTTGHGLLGDI
jgi:hypothetical protein